MKLIWHRKLQLINYSYDRKCEKMKRKIVRKAKKAEEGNFRKNEKHLLFMFSFNALNWNLCLSQIDESRARINEKQKNNQKQKEKSNLMRIKVANSGESSWWKSFPTQLFSKKISLYVKTKLYNNKTPINLNLCSEITFSLTFPHCRNSSVNESFTWDFSMFHWTQKMVENFLMFIFWVEMMRKSTVFTLWQMRQLSVFSPLLKDNFPIDFLPTLGNCYTTHQKKAIFIVVFLSSASLEFFFIVLFLSILAIFPRDEEALFHRQVWCVNLWIFILTFSLRSKRNFCIISNDFELLPCGKLQIILLFTNIEIICWTMKIRWKWRNILTIILMVWM